MKLQHTYSRIVVILVLLIFTNIIFAGKITGTVKQHGTMSPVQFATVTLIRTSDENIEMGQLTGNEGYFSFLNVPDDEYRIEVKFIGFDSYWSSPFKIDRHHKEKMFGEIFIEQGSIEYEEINVTAEKKILEVKADKKVFNIDNLKATSGGTCCDVIKKVPGVEVAADGTISLRGSSNVSVLVNEKRAGILGTDRSTNAVAVPIPASMIERVEIITNPSSEFDPDGMTGIINFVLKDENIKGYNGEVTANVGNSDKLNIGSTFSYRFPKTTLFSKTNYESANHVGNTKNDITIFQNSQEIDRMIHNSSNNRHAELYYYNGGFKHSLTDNHLFTAEGSYIKKNGSIDKQIDLSQTSIDSTWTINSEFTNEVDAYVLGIGSFNSFDNNSELDVEYFQDIQDENQNKSVNLSDKIEDSILQDRKIFTIDYRLQYKAFHIESGYKGRYNTFNKNQNDGSNISSFSFSEGINALYGLTSFKWNEKINFKFGLRYEWVENEIGLSKNLIIDRYNKLYPSAYITYSLNPFTQIRTSFSSRVNRPSAKQLDPYSQSDSFSSVDTLGNSLLKPEFTNLVEFGFSKTFNNVKLDMTSYNHFIQDPIQWVEEFDDNTLSNFTFENSGSGILNGVEGLLKYSPIHDLELRITGNYFRLKTVESINPKLNGITSGGYGRLIASYKTHGFGEFEVNGTYKTRRDSPQGYQWGNGKFVLDIAYQLSVLDDHLRITLKGVDLLDNDIFESNLNNYIQNQESHSYNYEKHDVRTYYVSMIYKFGNIN